MHLSSSKMLFAIIILLLTALSAWIPFKKKLKNDKGHEFAIFEALASGIFLGAGLIHMLGDANHSFVSLGIDYPLAYVLAGLVFLFLLFLEHLGREIHEHNNKIDARWVYLSVGILSIHSLLAGTALGMSLSLSTAIMVLIAIVTHKWAASFALAVQINKSNLNFTLGLVYFGIFALMTPLGVIFGYSLSFLHQDAAWWQAIFMSLAAGTFLYIGTLHGLTRAVMVHRCCNLKEYSFVILGFMIMAVVAAWT